MELTDREYDRWQKPHGYQALSQQVEGGAESAAELEGTCGGSVTMTTATPSIDLFYLACLPWREV